MKIIEVVQGSPEWLALRSAHFCASDAPVMMGLSKRTKRSELVRMKATGDEKEFTEWQQTNLLDKGHAVERPARALVEDILGEELYPITASDDDGIYLASYDGITMGGEDGYEHKLWNADLAAAIEANATEFPNGEEWQLEQQFLINPTLQRIHFVCSDGTTTKRASLVYARVPGRAERLVAGWKQLAEDVKNYTHVETPQAVRGRRIPNLPVIRIDITGKVKSHNLADYKLTAMKAIESVNTELKTDQDFADAAETVKFFEDAEGKLEAAKEHALSETSSIKELFDTLDDLGAAMRTKRLDLNRKVEDRKKAIRAEILQDGVKALADHVSTLNVRLGKTFIQVHQIPADFAGAMKGKKTIASLRDAVSTTLAHAKIASNEAADRIEINLKKLSAEGAEYLFLFADLAQIVVKPAEDFINLVRARIEGHKLTERQRQEEAARATTIAAGTVANAALTGTVASNVVPLAPARGRPTDDVIIATLARAFNVSETNALSWLLEMDLDAALEKRTTATAKG